MSFARSIMARGRHIPFWVWGVLLIFLGLTVGAAVWAGRMERKEAAILLARTAERTSLAVKVQIATHENLLRAAKGMIEQNPDLSGAQWSQFVRTVDVEGRYPAVKAFAFTRMVPRGELARYLARQPESFHLDTTGNLPELWIVERFEPLANNSKALGFDVAPRPWHGDSAQRARDTGLPSLSSAISEPMVSPDLGPSVNLQMAVYKPGSPLDSIEQRRSALVGWVSVALRVDVMANMAVKGTHPGIGIEVQEESGASIYRRDTSAKLSTIVPAVKAPLSFGGKAWILRFSPLETIQSPTDSGHSGQALVVGFAISFLLFGMLASLAGTRARALALADGMTRSLREAKELNRIHMEQTPLAAIIWDPEFRILKWNPSAVRIFGYSNSDALGKDGSLFLPPGVWPEVKASWDSGRIQAWGKRVTWPIIRSDGQERLTEWMSIALHDETGRSLGVASLVEDVTESRRAEAAFRASELRVTTAFRASPDGIIVSRMSDGGILEVNASMCRLSGWQREEMLGRTVPDLGLWDNAEARSRYLKALRDHGCVRDFEAVFHRKSGEPRTISISGELMEIEGEVLVLAVVHDITRRKRDEDLLNCQRLVLEQIAAGEPLEATLASLLGAIEALAPGMACSVLLVDADGRHLRHGAAPSLPDTYNEAVDGIPIGEGVGSCGTAAFRRQEVIVEDIASDPLWAGVSGLALDHGLRGCWSTPIFDFRDQVIGTLAMYYREPGKPTPWHRTLVGMATHIAAIAISRERAEAALRSSEGKFRTLYQSSPDGVMLLDERGFFDCNDSTLVMFGCATREAFCSKHPADLSPPTQPCGGSSRELADARIADAMELKPQRFEWVHRRVDTGDTFPVEVRLNALELDGRRVLQAVVRDNTERDRAAEAIRASEDRYRDLVEHSHEIVATFDIKGNFQTVNATAARLTGYPRETMLTMNLSDLLPSSTRHLFPEFLKALVANGHSEGTVRVQTAAGQARFWQYYNTLRTEGVAQPVVRGMALDITERVQGERELVQANRSLKLISACDEALVRASNEGDLLADICRIAVQVGGYLAACVGYAQEDAGHTIKLMAKAGQEAVACLEANRCTWDKGDATGTGYAGQVIRSGQAVIFKDIGNCPHLASSPSGTRPDGARSATYLPLKDGQRTFGLLCLYAGKLHSAAEKETKLLLDIANDLSFGIGNLRSRAVRQALQEAVIKIAQGVSAGVGEAKLDALIGNLVEALHANGGVIGRLDESGTAIETFTMMLANRKVENRSYSLLGTPCEMVLRGEICLFDRQVQQQFPGDPLLAEFGIEAFAGTPLRNSAGQIVGVLGVFFSVPMEHPELVRSTLRIFAASAAAELERQASSEFIRAQASLLDKAHDAILVRDMNQRILYWNQGAERLYGWTAEEVMGRSAEELLYADPGVFRSVTRTVFDQGEWSGPILQRRKDGSLLTVEAGWTLVNDDHGKPRAILAINTDITDRVESERRLQEYARRLETMRKIDASLLVAKSSREVARAALSSMQWIVPFVHAEVVVIDPISHVGSALTVMQDSRRQPLLGMAASIGPFEEFAEILSNPFQIVEDLGEIRRNKLEERIYELGLRSIVYLRMEDNADLHGFVVLAAAAPRAFTPVHIEIAKDVTDQLVVAIQHTRLREQLEISNQALESKVAARTAELQTTVSTLTSMEQELRRREAEAHAANQAKSTFLASMSHEVRTPLIGITGMLELLSSSRLDGEQRRAVDIINQSSQNLLQIIGGILDFSKIEAGKLELAPETIPLPTLVESVANTFSSAIAAKGLRLIVDVDPRLAPAHRVDPLRLRQILNNFMSNALKFTERGSITLRVSLHEARAGIETVAFDVEDTGIGVSEEGRRKLFEPFSQAEATTTRRFGGTGLGLVICRRLAEMMGGRISLESLRGEGTTLSLMLPLPVETLRAIGEGDGFRTADPAPLRMAPSIAAAEAGGCLVLLAEDHPINRTVLIQQVTRAGFALEVAVDGQEAFDRWLTGRYGLILTDLHMPRMDGYQLTEAVRNFESLQGIRRTPIIALTANALDGEAERCLLLGMDDYLIKPVTISQLGTKLHQWMPGLSPAEHPPAADIPPARAGAQPTLDVTVLQELCGIGSGAADEILDSFIATTEADLQQLEEYSTRQDWPGLARVAHRIKGASNTVGARELAARAALLESLAASEGVDASSFQEPLEEIQHAFRALLDHRGRTR